MNRLLIKLENIGEHTQFARIHAFKTHLTVETYTPAWVGQRICLTNKEILYFKEHPELVGIYTDGAWSAIGLAALVDIFATDDEEDQTEVPEIETETSIQ